ncbi:hypothetical protein BH24CHL1_BH24CHL1_02990 [soil metagenome]|jgi:hypothetical protein
MSDPQHTSETEESQQGLFKRFPKLSIIIVALVAYGLLFGMCAVVGVLLIRG